MAYAPRLGLYLALALVALPLHGYDREELVASGQQAAQAGVFNIKHFGAIGDGMVMETKAIQKTIDACHDAGGGVVWVPAGDFQIGTIRLKSNVTLSLDHGATLLGSQNIADYPTEFNAPREGGGGCLIYAANATNIRIEGLGVIDGRGTPEAFPRQTGSRRPNLLLMVECQGLTFSGVTYRRPASWGLHLLDCRDVHFDAVTVRFRNNGFNNDGLDIDGCENMLIENCDIDSGDDAICLKSSRNPCRDIVVRNCKVASNTAAFKLGTSSRGGFSNISVTNCYFYDCPMGAIKLQLVDGGRLENVKIDRIVMKDVGNPIFIRLGNRGRSYEHREIQQIQNADAAHEGVPPGTLKNVRISNVFAEVTVEDRAKAARATYKGAIGPESAELTEKEKSTSGPIMIAGIPGHNVEDVVLENIRITYPGGGTAEDATRIVAEDITRYPEQFFFGVLPAWGAYIRHARNIEFKNVTMELRGEDKREKLFLEDVEGFVNH